MANSTISPREVFLQRELEKMVVHCDRNADCSLAGATAVHVVGCNSMDLKKCSQIS